MADFTLDQGYDLPEEDTGPRVPEAEAKQLATTFEVARKTSKDRLAEAVDKRRKLISEGLITQQRRSAQLDAQALEQKDLIDSANTALNAGADAFETIKRFKSLSDTIKKKEVEQAAVDNFSSLDPAQARILAKNKDAVKRDHEKLANQLFMFNLSQEWEAKRDSWLGDILDIPEALTFSFLDDTLAFGGRSDLFKEVSQDIDSMSNTEFSDKWRTKLEDMNDSMFFDNPDRTADVARVLASTSIQSANQADAFLGLEWMGTLAGLGAVTDAASGIKGITNSLRFRSHLGKTAVESGAAKFVAEDLDAAARAGTTGAGMLSDEEQIGYALASRTPDEYLDQVPSTTRKVVEANDRVLAKLDTLPVDAVQDAITIKTLRDAFIKDFEANYSDGALANFAPRYDKNGILSDMLVRVESEQGIPFASKEAAETYAKSHGWDSFSTKLDKATGGFYAELKIPATDLNQVMNSYRKVGFLKTLIFNPNEFLDKNYLSLSQAASSTETVIHNRMRDVFNSSVGKMSGKEKVNLARVMEEVARGDNPRWLSPDELITEYKAIHGEGPTNRQVLGYIGMRQLEDASYRLINRTLYKSKKLQGLGSFEYSGTASKMPSQLDGAALESLDELPTNALVFDEQANALAQVDTDFAGSISRKTLTERLKSSSLIKLGQGENIEGAEYILVPKNVVKEGALSMKQIGYVGGGRIFYDYNWIVNATRKRTLSQFGDLEVIKNPVALFGGKNRKEVFQFAKALEAARKVALRAHNGTLDIEEADDLVRQVIGHRFQTTDQVKEFLNSRGVELQDEIIAAADGEIPTKGGFKAATEGEKILHKMRSRLARSRTEHRLEDVRGGYGFLDPMASMEKSVSIASRSAAFSNYREKSVSMFVKTWGDRMKTPAGDGVNPLEVVESGVDPNKIRDLGQKEIAAINAHRQQLLQTIRFKTASERGWTVVADNLSDYFLSKGAVKLADRVAEARSANPVSKWKSLAFNARLGLFSPTQFILQASMAPSIAALSPRFGTQAMLDYLPLRMALTAKDPEMVKFLAKKLSKARVWSSDDAGDFIEYVKTFKELGISDFGASLPEIMGKSGTIGTNFGGKFLTKGRAFFREGELIPRSVAYGIAVRKWRKGVDKINPSKLPISSAEGRKFLLDEVNRLTLGLTGANVQLGLRGAASIPTQFWSYPIRMTTALFGKEFSAKEKALLYGSFFALWGTGGVPLADQMTDWWAKKYQVDLSKEEAKLLYNGVFDSAIFAVSDGQLDTDFSARQLGSFWPQVVKAFTENPLLTSIGGATGSSLGKGWDVFAEGMAPIMAARRPSLHQVTDLAMRTLASQITSVDRGYRGWLAWNTGVLRDRKGRIKSKMSNEELLLWAGGIDPAEFQDTFSRLEDLKANKDYSKEIAQSMFEIARARFDDPDNAQLYIEQMNALGLIAEQNGILPAALDQLANLMKDDNFSEEIIMRYMKARAQGQKVNPNLLPYGPMTEER